MRPIRLSPDPGPPMKKITKSPFVAAFAAFALLSYLSAAKADIPGLTLTDTIDPSLGTDAFGLTLLQVNHATHKLYTAGYPSDYTRGFGFKVVDTTSNTIIAGIDLGHYSNSSNGVWPLGIGIDESAAPVGDKVYLICRTDTGGGLLRTIDGPTNTNLTGEGTDVFFRSLILRAWRSIQATTKFTWRTMTVRSWSSMALVDKS